MCPVSVNYATKAMLEQIEVPAVLAIVTAAAASNVSVTAASTHPIHGFYSNHVAVHVRCFHKEEKSIFGHTHFELSTSLYTPPTFVTSKFKKVILYFR